MSQFTEQINACWLGKSIGGTLGMSREGMNGPHNLSFYDPIPTEPAPNDDLDLQVAWMHYLLESKNVIASPGFLNPAWKQHVLFPWDEYGCCLRNMEYGVSGTAVGAFDNWFGECMGAAIRSEMWACIAPGDPHRAAGFAYCDAVSDHCGDGVWAIVFFSALQSMAFVEKDTGRLLDDALTFLPNNSRLKAAIRDTCRWWHEVSDKKPDWRIVRELIMKHYGSSNFTDVHANVAFTILGWLAGEGDFGRSICIAANCGLDSDCSAATLGALLGILHSDCISSEWSNPIGNEIRLSPGLVNLKAPADISVLTDWIFQLQRKFVNISPGIGKVLPCTPPETGISPIRLNVETAWSSHREILQEEQGTETHRRIFAGSKSNVALPGHWLNLSRSSFDNRVLLIRKQFHLNKKGGIRVLGFSETNSAAWIDGCRLNEAPFGFGCNDSHAPSFHRGGRGIYKTDSLDEGMHELVIAVCAPEKRSTDIVLGIGDGMTHLWQPYALAEPLEYCHNSKETLQTVTF